MADPLIDGEELSTATTILADSSSHLLDELIEARDGAEGAAKTVLRKITKNVDQAFILLEQAEGMFENASKSGISITQSSQKERVSHS